jgi:hypothetical protein
MPWLEAQLALVKPRLLIPLGRHALAHFAPGEKISEVHGTTVIALERTLFPMYHPAAALHAQGCATRSSTTPRPYARRWPGVGCRAMRLVCAVIAGLFLLAARPPRSPRRSRRRVAGLRGAAGAPPHWLPNERWVMQHWLPYDEERLYSLLGVDRGEVWRWLRDDTRNLAGLARERGWQPEALARELVAPWRGSSTSRAPGAAAVARAARAHAGPPVAAHLLPLAAPERDPRQRAGDLRRRSREEFQTLRRSELSPLQICRLNGLSRSHAQRRAEQTLRAMLARGVRGQAIPRRRRAGCSRASCASSRAGCSRRATTARRR